MLYFQFVSVSHLVPVCVLLRSPFLLVVLSPQIFSPYSQCLLPPLKKKKKIKLVLSLISALQPSTSFLNCSHQYNILPLCLVTLTYWSWNCKASTLALLLVQLGGEAAAVAATQSTEMLLLWRENHRWDSQSCWRDASARLEFPKAATRAGAQVPLLRLYLTVCNRY